MTFWDKIKLLTIFLRLIRNPNRTDLIFKGVDLVSRDLKQEPVLAITDAILSQSRFKELYDAKYLPSKPTLEALSQFPNNSLGLSLHQHMHENNINFDLFPEMKGDHPIHYLNARVYLDHDIWHVLLGYDTSVEDELGLQAFGMAQLGSPFSVLIIAGGLLHLLLNNPLRAVNAVRKVSDGFSRGKKATFLLSIKLHDLFSLPLSEVQAICRL